MFSFLNQVNVTMKYPLPIVMMIFTIMMASSCHNNTGAVADMTRKSGMSDSANAGKSLFNNSCVRCHGVDASGLTGPSLKRAKLRHAPDLESFISVVMNGIPGTGMPGNWTLTESDCHALFAYIGFLRTQGAEPPKGDTAAGRIVYNNSICATCHVMNGQGNSIGPELTEIGGSRNAAYLRQAMTDPGATLPESVDPDNGYGFSLYLPVDIITAEGKKISGIRINEDTYTIQLKDPAGTYYSFQKDQLASLEKRYGQSLMPSFRSKLSVKDLDDLVAFLSKSGNK